MIIFKNVTKIYPINVIALKDISFELGEKEFLLLVGRSGAGKTTLLKLILAEEPLTEGHILLNNQDIDELKKSELSFLRRKIGAVFQDYKLISSKTVYENIAFIMEASGADDEEIEMGVLNVLEIVGLKDKTYRFPNQLSCGERQRVALARALIHRPEIILADEPTGNLDPYNASDIIRLLLKINELGTTVILATHNKDIMRKLNKRTILLKSGRLERDDETGKIIL